MSQKKWGQYFLRDTVSSKIVDQACITSTDHVLEIGPGKGALTRYILQKTAHYHAIEKDPYLVHYLHQQSINAVQADILDFPLESIEFNKVISNPPFHLISPILSKLLILHQLSCIVLVMPDEVAQRLIAEPSSSLRTPLSLYAQAYSECAYLFKIPKQDFTPIPQVDSACVLLKPHPIDHETEPTLRFLKKVFTHKRKKLSNALKYEYPTLCIEKAIQELNLSQHVRPQDLLWEEWKQLARILKHSSH